MPVRPPVPTVVVPATALLVPGAAGAATVLAATRAAVAEALAAMLDAAAGGPLVVLAPGPRGGPAVRAGRLRPSLAGAGVADRWVPALASWPSAADVASDASDAAPGDPEGDAHVPASVATLVLAEALERRGEQSRLADVVVVEVAAAPLVGAREDPRGDADRGGAAARVRGAAGVVVAAGPAPGTAARADAPAPDASAVDLDLDPAVRQVLQVASAGWDGGLVVTRVSEPAHDHLAAAYDVAVWRTTG